jgi:hypothetical protein
MMFITLLFSNKTTWKLSMNGLVWGIALRPKMVLFIKGTLINLDK